MRVPTLPLLLALLLLAGCLQSADNARPAVGDGPLYESDCPQPPDVEEGTIHTDVGEYNFSQPRGGYMYSGSYKDFAWAWPYDNNITLEVVAAWDPGTLGAKDMQLFLGNSEDSLHAFALTHGVSPLVLNVTMTVPEDGSLRVEMDPYSNGVAGTGAGLAVSGQSFDTHVTVTQALLCP